MSENRTYTAICKRVIRAASRHEFAAPWERLNPDPAAFRAPTDPSVLLNQLQREFPLTALQGSGVVGLGENDAPELLHLAAGAASDRRPAGRVHA